MKKNKFFTLAMFFALTTAFTIAQEVAHINSDELVGLMPETKAAETEIKSLLNRHETEIKKMEAELEKGSKEFETKTAGKNAADLSQTEREALQKEYQLLQGKAQRLQEYQQTATKEVSELRQRKLTPIQKKVTDAINAAAAKKGVKYVFDSSILLYYNGGYNLLEEVKKELGL